MAQSSHIEWTDATWNPVTGCTKISPRCKALLCGEDGQAATGHEAAELCDWIQDDLAGAHARDSLAMEIHPGGPN